VGLMSYELQKLQLSASSPVASMRALRPIMLTARELSLRNFPSSKSNVLSVDNPFILIPQCV